ncbi:MAG: MFS transporter [Phycisphaerales bacterium]|nr:MFS transporter [Phycisphaerales bacterium]
MRLPNLLATRKGRLAAFFFLYMTEGIPLGFAATAVATQLRRQDVGPAAIGAFVGSLYLPWAFKWAFGPVVDVLSWERLGRRRGWILITQLMMAVTLLSAITLRLPEQLGLFTIILLIHNTFGATQDVAIDALACNTLHEDERGAANGLMFGGAFLGQTIGGSGVLYLSGRIDFRLTFFFVAGCILLVTALVVLPMREPASPDRTTAPGPRWRSALLEIRAFAKLSFRSVVGSRPAFAALFFALLPIGAMSLGLALGSNLAVELGLNDNQVATLNFVSSVVSAALCVLGGFLSDRVGRRKLLAIGVVLTSIPVLLMMVFLQRAGWIMPVEIGAPDRPVVPHAVLVVFWIASIVFAALNGVSYGVRSAIFMDVTNPAVAATQFTAYMALMNLTTSYTATWQGVAIETWGYPGTMAVDAALGLACLALLPFMRRVPEAEGRLGDGSASGRARGLGLGLATLLVAWIPYHLWHDRLGAAQPIADTFFTLSFVASAVFLAAGGAVLSTSAPIASRVGVWVAPLLLLMCGRAHADTLAGWLGLTDAQNASSRAIETALFAIPALGAAMLLLLALRPWRELEDHTDAGTSDTPTTLDAPMP